MEKLFNPYEWIPKTEEHPHFKKMQKSRSAVAIENEVENIITRIENRQIDLTINYTNWVVIGFSFASEFGEAGRDYFHRVSKFHPDYKIHTCDLQFDFCLKRPQGRITVKTFFFLAKSAGINIR